VAATVDPARGNARAFKLRAQLAQGEWADTHAFLDSARDPATRAFFVSVLADWPGRPEWLDAWCAARPGSAAPWLVRGVHTIGWAWEARGAGLASTVEGHAWPTFVGRLQAAVQDLAHAAQIDPRDPTPWVWRISAAIGLGEDLDMRRALFEEARRRDPHNYAAHVRMLTGLTKKWGGSHDAMFAFVRASTENAPAGSPLHSLLALAHLERCIAYSIERHAKAVAVYFRTRAVRADIEAAWANSIGSPRHVPALDDVERHNLYGFLFWQALDPRKAARALKAAGGVVTESPWQHLGEPGTVFAAAQQETSEAPCADVDLAKTVRGACQQAFDVARSEGIDLDYSEGAVARADTLLASARRGLQGLPEAERERVRLRIAVAHGAHLGEVLRRKLGGSWGTQMPGGRADGSPCVRISNMYYLPMLTLHKLLEQPQGEDLNATFARWVEQLTNPSVPDAPPAVAAADTPPAPSPGEPAWFNQVLLGTAADRAELTRSMSRDPQLAEELLARLESALVTAAAKWQSALDLTPKSLESVDALLGELHDQVKRPAPGSTPIPTEAVRRAAMLWGIYVGEVIRRLLGGHWIVGAMITGGPQMLMLEMDEATIAPTSKVQKRILEGPGDAIPFYAHALQQIVREKRLRDCPDDSTGP
jgi:hypothetical protein